jgi:hypothetical protein
MATTNGTLKRWKGRNFFEKISVSSNDFEDNMVSWDFTSVGIAVMVESNDPTDVIEYSFGNGPDGQKQVHGDMTPLMPSEGIIFDNRSESKIWFRRATAGKAVLVRIESWRCDA